MVTSYPIGSHQTYNYYVFLYQINVVSHEYNHDTVNVRSGSDLIQYSTPWEYEPTNNVRSFTADIIYNRYR